MFAYQSWPSRIPYLAENAGYSPMNLGHNILDSVTPPEERAVVNRH